MHKDIVVSEMKVNSKLHLTEHNTRSLPSPSCMRGEGRYKRVKIVKLYPKRLMNADLILSIL